MCLHSDCWAWENLEDVSSALATGWMHLFIQCGVRIRATMPICVMPERKMYVRAANHACFAFGRRTHGSRLRGREARDARSGESERELSARDLQDTCDASRTGLAYTRTRRAHLKLLSLAGGADSERIQRTSILTRYA